jgi:hypothetical protein
MLSDNEKFDVEVFDGEVCDNLMKDEEINNYNDKKNSSDFLLKIKFKDYQKLVESASFKDINSNNNKENRYKYLNGNFIEILEEQLREIESSAFEIQAKNYVLNESSHERIVLFYLGKFYFSLF